MNREIRRILVAVDGSDDARRALLTAAGLAGALRAHLTVLEVVEEFGPLPGYYDAAPPGVDRVAWVAEQRFEHLEPVLAGAPIAWDRRVESGDPAGRICDVASEGDYDLVVVGSRGLRAVARFLVGSISDRVVHHAPCSVLVVR